MKSVRPILELEVAASNPRVFGSVGIRCGSVLGIEASSHVSLRETVKPSLT
jgi:hypothetical protein